VSQLLQAAIRNGAAFEVAAVARVGQGIPFTAGGNIAYGPAPITYHNAGLPFNAAGQIAAALEGVVTRIGNGGAPFNAAGLLCISAGVGNHFSASIPYTEDQQVTIAAVAASQLVTNNGEPVTNNGEPVTNG
jgi:hypothetical protein